MQPDAMTCDLDDLSTEQLVDLNRTLGATRAAILERQRAVTELLDRRLVDAESARLAELDARGGDRPPTQSIGM